MPDMSICPKKGQFAHGFCTRSQMQRIGDKQFFLGPRNLVASCAEGLRCAQTNCIAHAGNIDDGKAIK